MTSKYLYGAAAAALLLSACSQDEVVNMRQDGINYNVLAKNQTRAADSYCNILLPGHFNVWARTTGDNALYINGDKIVNNNGSWTDEDGVRYWPQGKNLDFFAHVNGDGVFNYNNGTPTFNNFKVKANVPDQLDLMYAVENNASNSSAPVTINFRHALSQVCFRATNNTKNLQVTIKSVTVGHLTDGGTYTYPTASTTENIVDPDHNDVDNGMQNGVRGTWVLDNNYNNTYTASVNGGSVTLASGDVNTNLTCPGDNHANGFVNVMTLMPQQVNAWDPSQKGASYNGAYFLLDVEIKNVVDNVAGTTVYSGGAVVPVNVDWKEGYRYIYTFIFDEGGNGGFTPNPDDPQPVLAGIQYNVTVDDFIPVNGDGSGTGMDTGDQTPQYDYTGVINLYNNDGSNNVQISQIKTNNASYSFVFDNSFTPSREGYDFLGWASSADAEAPEHREGETATLNLVKGNNAANFFAVWKQINTTFEGIINYYINDEKIASATGNRTHGDILTLSRIVDGHRINWWSIDPEFKEQTVSITWDKAQPEVNVYTRQFILSFNGKGENVTGTPESLYHEGNDESYTFKVPEATMKNGNYEFKGWSDKEKVETLDDIKYQEGDDISLTKESPCKTIYAVWATPSGAIVSPGSDGNNPWQDN